MTPPKWRAGANWPPKTAIIKSKVEDRDSRDKDDKPTYSQRLVRCHRGCTRWTDTTMKQMWVRVGGYRNICCIECKVQSRTSNWTCSCNALWHKCHVHRVDPPMHITHRIGINLGRRVKAGELMPTSRATPGVGIRKGARHTYHPFSKLVKSKRQGSGFQLGENPDCEVRLNSQCLP